MPHCFKRVHKTGIKQVVGKHRLIAQPLINDARLKSAATITNLGPANALVSVRSAYCEGFGASKKTNMGANRPRLLQRKTGVSATGKQNNSNKYKTQNITTLGPNCSSLLAMGGKSLNIVPANGKVVTAQK
jgi:hypothetical protein